MGGTSQATPYITGMATLAQQIAQLYLGRELTVTEFNALLDTTSHLINDGDNEDDNVVNTGLDYPRINVLALAEAIITLDGDLSSDLDFGNPILNQLLLTINDNPSANPLQTYGDASVFKGNSLPQDKPEATVTYLDNGNEVKLENNAWKAWTPFDADSYTITSDTVLTFDYMSTEEGEIQGIGFDNNDNFFDNTQYLFQLFGTQTFGDTVQDFNNYQISDGWKSYSINVGEYFTGTFERVFLANDNDTSDNLGSNSSFRNIVLFENPTSPITDQLTVTVDGTTINDTLERYGEASVFNGNSLPQDTNEAVVTYSDNGHEVKLENNSWKSLDITGYTVTENTRLSFQFRSSEEAEIQGLGLDNDDDLFNDRNTIFQLYGTQTFTNQAFNDYQGLNDPQATDGWKDYNISLGQYFTGEYDRLVFVNDNDTADNLGGEAQFRNIVLSEVS